MPDAFFCACQALLFTFSFSAFTFPNAPPLFLYTQNLKSGQKQRLWPQIFNRIGANVKTRTAISYAAIAALVIAMLFALAGCPGGEKNGAGTGTGSTGSTATGGRAMPTAEGNKAEGDTIKIGMIASLNGENQPWGVDSKKGAELAVEEFNAANPDMKIQLI